MKLTRLALLALPLAIVAAACGDPDTVETAPSSPSGIEHPTEPGEVVLQLTIAGGYVPAEVAFSTVPTLTIYGDGRILAPGAMTMIYPGPLLPPMFERTITEEGIQAVLEAAEEHGLLAEPPSYESAAAQEVTDLPTTELVINAAGGRWVHSAYALQEGAVDTPERQELFDFVQQLGNLPELVGEANLGPEEPWVADEYRIRATPDPEPADLEPTIAPWPDPAVDLAEATECAVVSGAAVAKALNEATQLTWFTQDGTTYSLMARPLLPGDQGC